MTPSERVEALAAALGRLTLEATRGVGDPNTLRQISDDVRAIRSALTSPTVETGEAEPDRAQEAPPLSPDCKTMDEAYRYGIHVGYNQGWLDSHADRQEGSTRETDARAPSGMRLDLVNLRDSISFGSSDLPHVLTFNADDSISVGLADAGAFILPPQVTSYLRDRFAALQRTPQVERPSYRISGALPLECAVCGRSIHKHPGGGVFEPCPAPSAETREETAAVEGGFRFESRTMVVCDVCGSKRCWKVGGENDCWGERPPPNSAPIPAATEMDAPERLALAEGLEGDAAGMERDFPSIAARYRRAAEILREEAR